MLYEYLINSFFLGLQFAYHIQPLLVRDIRLYINKVYSNYIPLINLKVNIPFLT